MTHTATCSKCGQVRKVETGSEEPPSDPYTCFLCWKAEHVPAPQSVCDFCSSSRVRWAYPADDFPFAMTTDGEHGCGSKGPWAACDECSALIERGDYPALRMRSLATMNPTGEENPILDVMLGMLHGKFRASRTGPRQEVA